MGKVILNIQNQRQFKKYLINYLHVLSQVQKCKALCQHLFFIGFYVYANDEENRVITSKTSDVTNFLDVFNLYASVTVMTVQVLTSAYQQSNLVTAINTLATIDEMITNHGIIINYYAARKYITGKKVEKIHTSSHKFYIR